MAIDSPSLDTGEGGGRGTGRVCLGHSRLFCPLQPLAKPSLLLEFPTVPQSPVCHPGDESQCQGHRDVLGLGLLHSGAGRATLGLGRLTTSVSFFPRLSGDTQHRYWVGASVCSVRPWLLPCQGRGAGCCLVPNGCMAPGQGWRRRVLMADGDPPVLQGTAAACPTPSWATPPTTATVTAPLVSATCCPSPPCLWAGGCAHPSRAHPVHPSLQGPVPLAALRVPPTAWALSKSPTATWVSPGQWRGGQRGHSLAEPTCPAGTGQPQRCCAASTFPALPSPSRGKGPWVRSPSVQARSGVSAGAGAGQALGNPWARPCSCSGNSRFPLKGRSSSSGARPPPR